MPSNHFILCHPFLLPLILPSITVFSSELALRIGWPKYWSFSFNISPSNEYSRLISFQFSCKVMSNSLWPPDCSTPGFPVLNCLLEFAQTHVHWVSDANQPSHPLSPLLFIPLIFPSIRVFFPKESVLGIRWPKYWSFSFSKGPSNEYSGLIAFRIDWFDLLAIQGTLKSLFQHHGSKASILLCSEKQ